MKRFLNYAIVAVLALSAAGAVSCDKEEERSGSVVAGEPTGTIETNIGEAELSIGNFCKVRWEKPNNIVTGELVKIVNVGKVEHLGQVDIGSIPEVGWADNVAVVPGTAYIARYTTMTYESYSAFYVVKSLVDGTGTICGANIKYCPFSPEEGWNK